MSNLSIVDANDVNNVKKKTDSYDQIKQLLSQVGVRFERWPVKEQVNFDSDQTTILDAYQHEIDYFLNQEGYKTVDVISISSDHPQRQQLREKFLSEHTHTENEVRYFVAGQGLFSLHIEKQVYEVLCVQGDLISVPKNTKHWFDMGGNPNLIAIRFFDDPQGWVAHFTGSAIAEQYSRLEN